MEGHLLSDWRIKFSFIPSKGKLKDEFGEVFSQDQCGGVIMVRGKCKFMLTQNTSLWERPPLPGVLCCRFR